MKKLSRRQRDIIFNINPNDLYFSRQITKEWNLNDKDWMESNSSVNKEYGVSSIYHRMIREGEAKWKEVYDFAIREQPFSNKQELKNDE